MLNYFEVGPVVQEMMFKDFISIALAALMFCRVEPFVQSRKRALYGILLHIFLIWTSCHLKQKFYG